ncbi:MAG: Flagellar protein [Pseudomonadota bacterium]|jgi:flagellar protein FliS
MKFRGHAGYNQVSNVSATTEASPAELINLVFDRVLDCLRQSVREIESGKSCEQTSQRAIELITQGLQAALDFERGGEISKNLAGLYDWSVRQIIMARSKNNAITLGAVIAVMTDLQAGWKSVLDAERAYRGAPASVAQPSADEVAQDAGQPRLRVSA